MFNWRKKRAAVARPILCEICDQPAIYVYVGNRTQTPRCGEHGRGKSTKDIARDYETRGDVR